MKYIYMLVVTSLCLLMCTAGKAQTMTNSDNVITLNGTCINAGMTTGTYNMVLVYVDQDNGPTTLTINGVSVGLSGNVLTITSPTGGFPTDATRAFDFAHCSNGSISLTSTAHSAYMNWSLNPDGNTDAFNCIALPIWFNSFTGTLSGSTVVLNWQTGLESNTSVIEIYRSSTGSNYYKIGQVTAAGNSSIPVNYTFTDLHPDASNYYYLKMVSSVGAAGIFSITIHVTCSSCHYTPPTPVFCNYTINGPDHICSVGTASAYTLSAAVPNFNSIAWSIDVPSEAILTTYPAFDRTKASLLKKNASGVVVLKATLSGCSNAISKVIALGTPWPYFSYDYECDYLSMSLNNTPGATSINWIFYDATSGVTTEYDDYGSTNYWQITNADTYYVSADYTNACGTSGEVNAGGFQCDNACDGCLPVNSVGFTVSPNPSSGIVSIGMAMETAPATAETKVAPATAAAPTVNTVHSKTPAPTVHPKVYQVRVIDVQGIVRKTFNYPGGMDRLSLDLSSLNNGVYIIQVFDNKTWKSNKVILAK